MKILIDTNSLLAIGSFFSDHPDPWANNLLEDFADAYIYFDEIAYTFPRPVGKGTDPKITSLQGVPLLAFIHETRPEILQTKTVDLEVGRSVSNDVVNIASVELEKKLSSKLFRDAARKWLDSHLAPEIWNDWNTRYGDSVVFDIDALDRSAARSKTIYKGEFTRLELLYLLDNILRLPVYGEIAASESIPYLNHPLRSSLRTPYLQLDTHVVPKAPISWGKAALDIAEKGGQNAYFDALDSLREQTNVYGITLGESDSALVSTDLMSDMARKAGLRPRLRHVDTVKASCVGAASTLGAVHSPAAMLTVGIVLGIASNYWTGGLPSGASRISWLRWALDWGHLTEG